MYREPRGFIEKNKQHSGVGPVIPVITDEVFNTFDVGFTGPVWGNETVTIGEAINRVTSQNTVLKSGGVKDLIAGLVALIFVVSAGYLALNASGPITSRGVGECLDEYHYVERSVGCINYFEDLEVPSE